MRKVSQAELDKRKIRLEQEKKERELKQAYIDEVLPLIINNYEGTVSDVDIKDKIEEVKNR